MYASAENDLHDKSQRAGSDIRDGAHRIKEDVREAAGKVKHDMEDIAREAGCQARGFIGSTEESVTAAFGSMTTKIRDNPVQSSVIAMGIGVVLGLMLFRR